MVGWLMDFSVTRPLSHDAFADGFLTFPRTPHSPTPMYRRPHDLDAVDLIIRERPEECRVGEWVRIATVKEDPRFRPELGVIQYHPESPETGLMTDQGFTDEPPFPLVIPGAIWIFVLRKLMHEDGTMEPAWFREL